ncbi:MAG: hypothetical protein DMG92_12800 [Acidobacteria bacterium]|nr:MAG: hypothetical protein DMG92_12800 [Acidobacteriota bacterium]
MQPELHIWQPNYAAFDLSSDVLGGTVKHNQSWISLIGYCLATAFGAAIIFAIIVAGGSVALANHQTAIAEEVQNDNATSSSQISDTTPNDSSAAGQNSDQQSPPAPQPNSELESFSGFVTDSVCGARHKRRSNLAPEDCARACLRSGATYILVDGDRRYRLSGDQDSLSKLLGTRATITGTRKGQTISVSSAGPQT